MATYGPGQRRSSKQSAVRSSSRAPAKAVGKSKAADATASASRSRSSSNLRGAIEGREHEFAGIGLIAAGILIGLAIYFNLAGPLGRGVETLVGWFTGLGRYVVPAALVGIGAALIHRGRSDSRVRLVFGWGASSLAVLGLLHVVRGPEKLMADFDAFGTAGGWLGAIVGEPMRSLIADAGAIVMFVDRKSVV